MGMLTASTAWLPGVIRNAAAREGAPNLIAARRIVQVVTARCNHLMCKVGCSDSFQCAEQVRHLPRYLRIFQRFTAKLDCPSPMVTGMSFDTAARR